jgi:hypothetical protein
VATIKIQHDKGFNTEDAEIGAQSAPRKTRRDPSLRSDDGAKLTDLRDARNQPRTRTSLKLTSTRPPACGRPKLNCGRKRENNIT